MSVFALLLLAIALADVARSVVPPRARALPVAVALLVPAAGIPLGGLTGGDQLLALGLAAPALLLWVRPDRATPDPEPAGRGSARRRAALRLAALGTAAALTLLVPSGGDLGGPLATGLTRSPLVPTGVDAARVLLVLALLLAQLSTGNRVVRDVLTVADVYLPATVAPGEGRAFGSLQGAHVLRAGEPDLKGGRLLGPMERLLILGLGLAGELTAAGIVVAAKGLVRWPELSRAGRRDRERDGVAGDPPPGVEDARRTPARRARPRRGPDIDQITEYFLVGSFTSWMVALAALALAALAAASAS